MGTVVAVKEDTARVANTPDDNAELVEQIRGFEKQLDLINRLDGFRRALREVEEPEQPHARYYLLELDPNADTITVTNFKSQELGMATELYERREQEISQSGGDAVLVSVDSIASLRRAYPNYFLDTHVFLDLLTEVLEMGL